MAETPSTSDSGSLPSTLARGKACLRCRKRKMRCDGTKPACVQCLRAKKPDSCQYDDGKGRTRTQALREKIMRLEEQIQQMRDPDYSSPSIVLHDPHAHSRSDSSSSSLADSPCSTALSISNSPYSGFGEFGVNPVTENRTDGDRNILDPSGSPQPPWTSLRPISPSVLQLNDDPPLELSQMLLDIFLPHKHQCGFVLHVDRLRASISRRSSQRRHPVLMNAIFLWSCFLSRPASLSQHEQHYLQKTQEALVDALSQPNHVVDIIQATCLLSRYFFACGRLQEASFHASSAATLAVHAGLHRIVSVQPPMVHWSAIYEGTPALQLDPPQDAIEFGERTLVFWQAYILDRCISVALQRPTCIIDGDGFDSRIDTPWPVEIEEYENTPLDSLRGDSTLRMYFAQQGQPTGAPGGFSMLALRVKAAALYEAGNRLAANWGLSSSRTGSFSALELTISRFFTNLLPAHQLDAAVPDDRREFVVIQTLAHGAIIQLHQRFARDDPSSMSKCLRAARNIVALVRHVADPDYEFLDPIIGTCWANAASIFALEQGTWSSTLDAEPRPELDTIIFAMTKLSARFPLTSFQVAKVLQTLAAL